jgi:hypothetical protein
MDQFVPHGEGDKDMIEQITEGLRAIDQDEVMERTSVGNDDAAHLFRDAAKDFEVCGKLLAFANAESLGVLQKGVGFEAIQFEQLPDLGVRDLALAESLGDEGLQCLSRQIIGLSAERLYQ